MLAGNYQLLLLDVATTTSEHGAGRQGGDDRQSGNSPGGRGDAYRWIALSNTTLAMVMATIDGSIVIVAMPAIFRGIGLNPLTPGNVTYLLWMIMGYLLVQSILVVTLGRLGDIFGRVKIYNLGFVVFTLASIGLSFDPFQGTHGALWLIGWRFVQAFGGSMLMANSAAILTDAFPEGKRGTALGINQVAGISGQFVGLLLGGLLSAWDWRAVFWINLPFVLVCALRLIQGLRSRSLRRFELGLGAAAVAAAVVSQGIVRLIHAWAVTACTRSRSRSSLRSKWAGQVAGTGEGCCCCSARTTRACRWATTGTSPCCTGPGWRWSRSR